ncbi:hypothetical protein ACN6AT_36085 (plasmid) [Streptomyces sp. JL4002]|uniref:hypothetical protein n=1 Tax=Streptomyces sp. JL4002 TaxID=3404781 RepID=UPI003B27B6B0
MPKLKVVGPLRNSISLSNALKRQFTALLDDLKYDDLWNKAGVILPRGARRPVLRLDMQGPADNKTAQNIQGQYGGKTFAGVLVPWVYSRGGWEEPEYAPVIVALVKEALLENLNETEKKMRRIVGEE